MPVISTDCKGGVRELLAPTILFDTPAPIDNIKYADFGLLVPVGNAALLAEAMRKIYSDHHLRQAYSIKGKERAKDFDLSIIIQSFQEVLE